MCNTCCNSCNSCGGLFRTLFGCGCNPCHRCNPCGNGCGGCGGCGCGAANTGCGCGASNAGCGCTRRVGVPITGRIYLDLPYYGAGQAGISAGCGGTAGCTTVAGVSANNCGFDAYYARQYGLYPYNTANGCGC